MSRLAIWLCLLLPLLAACAAPAMPGPPIWPALTAASTPLRATQAGLPATWRLTPPGCCPAARWAADGRRVIFYARPEAGPAGAWTADLTGTLAPLWPRFGYTAAGDTLLVSAAGEATRVERLDGSLDLMLANGGVETLPAPDGSRVAYLARLRPGGRTGDSQERVTVAALDGSPPRGLLDLARADYLRWFPDSRRLAVFGWRPEGVAPGLWVVDSDSGAASQIVAANFLAAIEVAPDGQWLAYLATLQPNPNDNGLWVVRPDGSERRRLEHARAARWAADSQALLALVPVPGGKEVHRLDLATGARSVLVGRDQVDFDVEADDWSVSPDGRYLLYRSSRDRALWVLQVAP